MIASPLGGGVSFPDFVKQLRRLFGVKVVMQPGSYGVRQVILIRKTAKGGVRYAVHPDNAARRGAVDPITIQDILHKLGLNGGEYTNALDEEQEQEEED